MNGEHKVGGGILVRPLLSEKDVRALLGGMSERKFKELRATGVVPPPLELGPRIARWTHADFDQLVAALPRRAKVAEPERLTQSRRARLERTKAATA